VTFGFQLHVATIALLGTQSKKIISKDARLNHPRNNPLVMDDGCRSKRGKHIPYFVLNITIGTDDELEEEKFQFLSIHHLFFTCVLGKIFM
jgi:hypothetical protein